jgi:hypothetical protein
VGTIGLGRPSTPAAVVGSVALTRLDSGPAGSRS